MGIGPHSSSDWNVVMNSVNNIDVVYLDFCREFDSVVHSKLIAKLSCYSIYPVLLSWICSFLSNRFQYVKVDKSYSSILPVTSGVPMVVSFVYCLYYILTTFALWLL